MTYIYKITNTKNNKLYIGKTEETVESRFKQHCKDAFKARYSHRPLYKAMKKYGTKCFRIEEIEKTTSELASIREQYWITFYNSYGYGYNATIGGDGKPYIDRDLVVSVYDKTKSIIDTAKICDINEETASTILKSRDVNIKTSMAVNRDKYGKPIAMYDKDNNYIRSFSTCADAARYLLKNNLVKSNRNTIRTHITEVAKGKRKTTAGFIWKFENK